MTFNCGDTTQPIYFLALEHFLKVSIILNINSQCLRISMLYFLTFHLIKICFLMMYITKGFGDFSFDGHPTLTSANMKKSWQPQIDGVPSTKHAF